MLTVRVGVDSVPNQEVEMQSNLQSEIVWKARTAVYDTATQKQFVLNLACRGIAAAQVD